MVLRRAIGMALGAPSPVAALAEEGLLSRLLRLVSLVDDIVLVSLLVHLCC